MGMSALRKMVSCVLLFLFPSSLIAADSNAAMLYTNGGAWVNGAHVPRASSAIFTGDLLQTNSESVANINQSGSTVTVQSDSLVQFKGTAVKIEHGAVTVATSKGMGTTAGDVKVTPASFAWTEFHVTDVDGTVKIAATKGDLLIDDGQQTTTLPQGQETTRDETADTTKKKKKENNGAQPAAGGGWLNSPIAVGIGLAAIGGVTGWVVSQSNNPASPSQP
jgi:hypothetical protein